MALTIGVDQATVVETLPSRPKRKGGHGRSPSKAYVELVNFVRSHQDEWVCIGSAEKRLQAQALAFRIRKGKSAAFKPEGAFKAETRANEESGQTDVFVMYLGEPVDSDQVTIDDVDSDSADTDDDEWGDSED